MQLIHLVDDALFEHNLHDPNHALLPLLLDDRILPWKAGSLQNNNFLLCQLYEDLY